MMCEMLRLCSIVIPLVWTAAAILVLEGLSLTILFRPNVSFHAIETAYSGEDIIVNKIDLLQMLK